MSNLITKLALSAGLDVEAYQKTIMATAMPNKGNGITKEQFAAFLMVADKYNLNPLTKEIYAFPANGGISPIVSIDGWMKLINMHPDFDGMEFSDVLNGESVIAITCKMFRKDRSHPIEATEYMAECKKETSVWKQWPRRMLRHKAAIQAARYAFGFAGIYDPDEGERIASSNVIHAEIVEVEAPQELIDNANASAKNGVEAFKLFWANLIVSDRELLGSRLDGLKTTAKDADAKLAKEAIEVEQAEVEAE